MAISTMSHEAERRPRSADGSAPSDVPVCTRAIVGCGTLRP